MFALLLIVSHTFASEKIRDESRLLSDMITLDEKALSAEFERRALLGSGFWEDVADVGEDFADWTVNAGEDALHATHQAAVWTAGEVSQAASDFEQISTQLVNDGIDAIENIPIDEVVQMVDALIEQAMCTNVDSCIMDIKVEGCMPGNGKCVITYGEHCLDFSYTQSASMEQEFRASGSREGGVATFDWEAGLSMKGGASASIGTNAVVALHLDNNPKIQVMIEPPAIEINAKVEISATGSINADIEKARVNLGPRKLIMTRVFMAGFLPVKVAVHAQPVAYITAHGSASASGSVTYEVSGTLGFQENLAIELQLKNFEASHNFAEVRPPTISDITEGWEFNFNAEMDIDIEAQVGVELSFSLYDMIEMNLYPSVVAKVKADGQLSASASGNWNSLNAASMSGSARAEVCLRGEITGYFDWVEGGNRRRPRNGRSSRGRRELEESHRRELGTIDFIKTIQGTCSAVMDAINCLPAKLSLEALCSVTTSGLQALDFPEIKVPEISDLEIFNIPTVDSCATMSLQASLDYETAQREGETCGGHFSGSTVGAVNIGGNAAGDAVYTFVAQSTRMLVNACSSDFDTVIRVWEKTTRYRRIFGRYVPYNNFRQIAWNDDHWMCRRQGNRFGSAIQLNRLRYGREYVLQIEGYRRRTGTYRVDITCQSMLG